MNGYSAADLHRLLEVALRELTPANPVLFEAVIEKFRAEEMPDRHSTRTAYDSMLKQWICPRWGSLPVGAIKTHDIEMWLKSMACAAKTRQHRKALLDALFNAAIRWEFATHNPVSLARVKGCSRRRGRPHILTVDQFRAVLSALSEPYRQMALLAGFLGLRASEIVALKWSDLDLDAGTLRVLRAAVSGRVDCTKTEASEDALPLDATLVQELREYSRRAVVVEDGWLFPSPATAGPYHQDTIRAKQLLPAGVAAGLPFPLGWHTFRHSFRRWLDEAGTPIGIIKELMRHAQISTTMDVYGVGTLTPAKRGAQKAVAEMLATSG